MSKIESQIETSGGVDLLDPTDRIRNPDEAEKNERQKLRNPDLLDGVLTEVLGKPVGGHLTDEHFQTLNKQGFRVLEEFTFARCYYGVGLLADFFNAGLNDATKAETAKSIADKRAFLESNSPMLQARAKKYGIKSFVYLPIIGGSVDLAAVRELLKGR
jgi:hypothetical protein